MRGSLLGIPLLVTTRCRLVHVEGGAIAARIPTVFFHGVVQRVSMRRVLADFLGIAARSKLELPVRSRLAFQDWRVFGRWICCSLTFC